MLEWEKYKERVKPAFIYRNEGENVKLSLFKKRPTRTIKIVFDSDLVEIIKKYEKIEEPLTAKYICGKCKKEITFDEIGSIKIRNNKIFFFCQKCTEGAK